MLEQPVIEIQDVKGRVDGERIVLDVAVRNPQARTLYAYETVRRIQYDPATRELTVSLHDHHIDADHPIAPHLLQPRFAQLEGGTVTPVTITLPRVVRRIRSAAEREGGEPMVEVLPIEQATRITIEMAHQDTPYYYNPRLDKVEQLRTWGEPVATATLPLSLAAG
jgi:hypothetical protein